MYHDELYHYGILGQKWGVRRFQNKDGSLTGAGKKRYGINPIMSFKNAKTKYKRKKALKKARKTREYNRYVKEGLVEKKKEWAKNPKTLSEHIDEFTNAEISEALTRLRLIDQVEQMKYDRVKRGVDYISQLGNTAKSISEISKMITSTNAALKAVMGNSNGGEKKKQGGSNKSSNQVNNKKQSNENKDNKNVSENALLDAVMNKAAEGIIDKAADRMAVEEQKTEEKEDK